MSSKKCCSTDLKHSSHILKTIAEENRLRIICLLKTSELCVCEIQEALSLSHNLVLHHLKIMQSIKLINKRKDGKHSYYSLNPSIYKTTINDLFEILK